MTPDHPASTFACGPAPVKTKNSWMQKIVMNSITKTRFMSHVLCRPEAGPLVVCFDNAAVVHRDLALKSLAIKLHMSTECSQILILSSRAEDFRLRGGHLPSRVHAQQD